GKLTDRTTFGPSKESDTVRGFITLGRFVHTVLPRFSAVQIDGHQLTPYVTKKGNIAFALNHTLPPFMRVHVDELTVGDTEHVVMRGRIYTRHSSIRNLQLQLAARATDCSISSPAQLDFSSHETALKYGLNRYTFQVEIPL